MKSAKTIVLTPADLKDSAKDKPTHLLDVNKDFVTMTFALCHKADIIIYIDNNRKTSIFKNRFATSKVLHPGLLFI